MNLTNSQFTDNRDRFAVSPYDKDILQFISVHNFIETAAGVCYGQSLAVSKFLKLGACRKLFVTCGEVYFVIGVKKAKVQ